MADLTLERLAQMREDMALLDCDIEECGGDSAVVRMANDEVKALLDAAERGLLSDRKTAAFDALDAMIASGRVTLKRPIYNRDLRIVDYSGSRVLVYHVDNLMDGIEQIDKHLKEPTDG